MKTVRWGIIGAGNISSRFATALSVLDGTELTAIASRNLDKANAFSEKFHIKKAYGSYEELVKDPEIDVIYIGTPHTEHKSNAELCIVNGKAVLCEKPFTLNQKDTEYLISLAKQYDVFLMEAMWTKFLPATNVVKKWIDDKIIGDIKYITTSFGFTAEFDANSRLFSPALAGGALLDVGIYPITYAIHIMGRLPDHIVSSAYLGKTNIDEMNVIAMRYNDGIMANLSSAITTNLGNDAVIIGEKGKIIVPNFWCANSAELYDLNGNLMDAFLLPFTANGYVYEAEEVNHCIRTGRKESDILPLKDTLEIMKILDEIRADWGLVYPSENSENKE